jgi:hypothetical protein
MSAMISNRVVRTQLLVLHSDSEALFHLHQEQVFPQLELVFLKLHVFLLVLGIYVGIIVVFVGVVSGKLSSRPFRSLIYI